MGSKKFKNIENNIYCMLKNFINGSWIKEKE